MPGAPCGPGRAGCPCQSWARADPCCYSPPAAQEDKSALKKKKKKEVNILMINGLF